MLSTLVMILTTALLILPSLTQASLLHDAIDTYIVQTDYGNIRGYSRLVLGESTSFYISQSNSLLDQVRSSTSSLVSHMLSLQWVGEGSGSRVPSLHGTECWTAPSCPTPVSRRSMTSSLGSQERRCGTPTLQYQKIVSTSMSGFLKISS